ncbi:hypothetical protein [Chryseobacterium hispalense]|uniref:hypothetical protein n=1 Tax=Chryseobacterium hispalense TaxID=1453492 RepID=UPI00391AD268
MIIGKITLDLNNLEGGYTPDELEIINQYFKNPKSLQSVKYLIPLITNWELILYSEEEDASFDYIYRYSDFLPITKEEFEGFKRRKVFDCNSTDIDNYYANFHYVDGKYIDSKTNKDIGEGDSIPCLIHLDGNMMTYYIFYWKYYDNHNFEIED